MKVWSMVLQHLAHSQTKVTNNKLTHGSESILVTNNNIYPKCYLSFFKIVADKMQSNAFSYAKIKGFKEVFGEKNKKRILTHFYVQNLQPTRLRLR